MDDIGKLGLTLAFSSILYALEKRPTSLTESTKIYLADIIRFFSAIVDELQNLDVDRGAGRDAKYNFVPNLKEIVAIGAKKNVQRLKTEDLKSLVGFFEEIIHNLRLLQTDPAESYRDKSVSMVASFLKEASAAFQENPMVLQEMGLEPTMAG